MIYMNERVNLKGAEKDLCVVPLSSLPVFTSGIQSSVVTMITPQTEWAGALSFCGGCLLCVNTA